MSSFYRGEILQAEELNLEFSKTVSRSGDTMGGPLFLSRDPQQPTEAVTKRYIDNLPPPQASGVATFNTRIGDVTLTSADVNGALTYVPYSSTNPAGYVTMSGAASAAPVQSFNSRTGAITLTSSDVTTALTYTPYNATNPNGYQTSAQVTAALPVASSTLPLVEGTAAIGSSNTYARSDHVHPASSNASVFISDSAPTLVNGLLWFDSAGSRLYIGYNDGNSSQWVAVA